MAVIEAVTRLKPGQYLVRLRRAPVYALVLRAIEGQGARYGCRALTEARGQPTAAAILDWTPPSGDDDFDV